MKRKPLTKSKLIKKLDTIFSVFIRLRDATPEGYVKCCTCPVKRHYKDSMHAGHFQARGFLGTRFDERNVNSQCVICNSFRDGNGPEYFRFMQEKYGDDVIDEIRRNKLRSFTASELEEMIRSYQDKVKEML